jgi:hypothetical protein
MATPNAMSLKECTVSMVGQDGQTHEAAVEAASLFDAADRALQQWRWALVTSSPIWRRSVTALCFRTCT